MIILSFGIKINVYKVIKYQLKNNIIITSKYDFISIKISFKMIKKQLHQSLQSTLIFKLKPIRFAIIFVVYKFVNTISTVNFLNYLFKAINKNIAVFHRLAINKMTLYTEKTKV